MSEYEHLTYTPYDEGQIVRIMLNRPEVRNAQNRGLLVELDCAFLEAEADDDVRVIILGGVGPIFSSGHDIHGPDRLFQEADSAHEAMSQRHPTYSVNGGSRSGAERHMLQEWRYFFQSTLRWRNLRKITIAQVQGGVYAAGLMLMWACDLIVAAEETLFADVVGTRLGMCGVEYFAHPWEFGPRKTKELMLTGDAIDANDAFKLGMVSKVWPLETLEQNCLEFAPTNRKGAHNDGALGEGVGESNNRHSGISEFLTGLFHYPSTESRPLGGDS